MGYSESVKKWREAARTNPRGFVEQRLRIKGTMGAEVPFRYRLVQRKYSDRKKEILKAGVPLRMIDLKYRRAGFSSVETVESYAQCYGRDNARIGILAHLESRAGELLNNFKDYNTSLNTFYPNLKQELSRENLFGIKFQDSSSQVLIASAENPIKIRGDGLHIVHCSEFAHFFHNFTPVVKEICPVVPSEAGSQIIMESTGSIVGSAPWEFYYNSTPWREFVSNGYKRSRGKNEFVRHFTCWRDEPECVRQFTQGKEEYEYGQLLDEIYEVEPRMSQRIANERYNLTPQQINWMWHEYCFKGASDYNYFCREFPFEEDDAWASGSDSYFGNHEVNTANARAEEPKWAFQFDADKLARVFESFDDLRQLEPHQVSTIDDYPSHPVLKIWQPPRPGERYVLGADSAQGDYGGDFSAGYIINMKTREMMAAYHGRMTPNEAAHINVSLCRIYNQALAAPETNPAGGGSEALNIMQRLGYHRIYVFKIYDGVDGIANSRKLGWWTNSRTRDKMLSAFRQLFVDCFNERVMLRNVFRDKSLINEMKTFGTNERSGRPQAASGCSDDRVIALAIAHQVACDETAGGRDDILQAYHPLQGPPRAPIDPKQQQKQITKVMSPEKTMALMFGKNSRMQKNKFSFTDDNHLW